MMRRSQDDFESEIRSHLDLETARLEKQGMTHEDALRAARRRFGNVGVAEDNYYHGRRFAWADDFGRDVRHALRGLLRTPAFLATSVVTLTFAIGAVTGMFDVVNTVMLRPLPFPNSDRLVFLEGYAPGSELTDTIGLGLPFYVHLKENSKLISGIGSLTGSGTSTLRVNDRVERVGMAWPTNDLFTTLQVQPQIGRLPRTEDRDDAVLISDRLWATWFNRDSAVIGKWYFVSDSLKQVIGVLPASFQYPDERTVLWVSGEVRATDLAGQAGFGASLVARLKPGVTPEQLAVEVNQLARQIPGRFGFSSPVYNKAISNLRTVVTPMLDGVIGPTIKTSLWILLGAVAVVLLIACANVANLFMVRGESRRRDLTVRRAIGASRTQLIRFQMTEAFVVALISGVLAVVLAAITLPIFVRSAPEGIPRLSSVHMDWTTVAAGFAVVIVVGLACGAVPAIRGSSPDLTGLRGGGRGSIGGRTWGRDALVVAQTAMALVLLIGSALLLQSFTRLRNVDAGYDTKDIYTFQYAPEQAQWNDGPSYGRLHLMMLDRFKTIPGVTEAGVVNNIPLDEGTGGVRVFPEGVTLDNNDGVALALNFTGGDYFKAIGMRVLAGRPLLPEEAYTPNTSAILSKSAAEKLWPGQPLPSIVGRRFRPRIGGQDTLQMSVVGIVNDVKQLDWTEKADAVMYLPLTGPGPRAWRMGSPAYVLKGPRAALITAEVRKMIREVAPEAPVYREFTMEFLTRRSMLELSFTTLTLGVLSLLALLLGAVGLYGTLSYVVAQRTREIGVRMALGATAGAVRRQVVGQGVRVVLVGAAIGIVGAYLTTKFLARLLFEVKPADPIAFGAMSALLLGMGMLASYMPARRASNVAPMEALRSD